jgi:hypothetical protein
MGDDFIRKKGPAHRKAWRDSATLATPDLFVQQQSSVRRTLRAACSRGTALKTGQRVLLRRTPEGVVACEGTHSVASLVRPPRALIQALEQGSGVACATVDAMHEAAGLADLRLDD